MSLRRQHSKSPEQPDHGDFRRALGQFVTGVTVVTTRAPDGTPVGLTVNSFNAVSLAPPMVLWSLRRASPSVPAFRRARHFAVNVLAHDQVSLSQAFARPGGDGFRQVEWQAGEGGVPLLAGVAAQFVCSNDVQHSGGDHLIFLGTVLSHAHRERAPLAYSGGAYARVEALCLRAQETRPAQPDASGASPS